MKKSVLNLLKSSFILSFVCALFSLACLSLKPNRAEKVSADNTSIYNYSGSVSRFDFGSGLNIPYRFSNVYYELNVSDLFNNEVHSYLYTFYIQFTSPNYVDYVSLDGEDDYTSHPLFTSGSDVASNSYNTTEIFDRMDAEIVGIYCRSSSLLGTVFDFNFDLKFYIDDNLIDTVHRVYSYPFVYNLGNTWRNDAFINGDLDDLLTSVSIDTSSISDYSQGYSDGYNSGFSSGYASGNADGYSNGYTNGYVLGVESQEQIIIDNYNQGYTTGYNEGSSVDDTASTIFSGILQIALVPVNFFLGIFNFEILGINMSSFVSALLTVAVTLIIIRTIFGGKNDDK